MSKGSCQEQKIKKRRERNIVREEREREIEKCDQDEFREMGEREEKNTEQRD